ncbi:DUF2235 domain-containing protein [Sphingomonas sp.]|uniref:DUF2235 domain-containing protein n=1 Tax=Sphingomonas sp. TaxID=28214 RepID=UPI003B3AADBF
MKRIVVCCDGTWNEPDRSAAGKPSPTNVVKLASLVPAQGDDGVEQRVFYHNGIGSMSSRTKRFIDGATGYGISRILLSCYTWLIRTYQPGDELYFFGFSRGAYTARSLAGFVRNSGILRPENESLSQEAFALYRSRDGRRMPRAAASRLFRRSYSWPGDLPIQCIGVWDTVGSLGVPNTIFQGILKHVFRVNREFHDTDLSSLVRYAFHAVAIDERRKPFLPTLWTLPEEAGGEQHLEQTWFPGCHGDVGGGNPHTGLSDITLAWMVRRARLAGLKVDDPATLVPPTFPPFHPDPLGPITQSLTPFYRLFGSGVRTIRDPAMVASTCETLSDAARDRWSRTDWRPPPMVDLKKREPDLLSP